MIGDDRLTTSANPAESARVPSYQFPCLWVTPGFVNLPSLNNEHCT